jgi:hypothetical protein
MSNFYGKLQGNRGMTTRCGSSGIWAQVKSWDWSIDVDMMRDVEDEEKSGNRGDVVKISTSRLSSGKELKIYVDGALITVRK